MPTILDLEQSGELERFDVELEVGELPKRSIFLLRRCADELNDRLDEMESRWKIEQSPGEQLYALAHHFVTGGELDYPRQFHDMVHVEDGVWMLKTPDLRLFGWFSSIDCFICTDVKHADFVKYGPGGPDNPSGSYYAGFCAQARYRRDQLDLDPPKFLNGNEPSDVVSDSYKSKS